MTEPRPCNITQTRFQASVQFAAIVASRSLRSEAAARKGSVGTYQMLEDVAACICMGDFGIAGADYLRPGRIRTLFTTKIAAQALSVLSQDWSARVQFALQEPGQRSLDAPQGGYLPPSAEPLPELRHLGLHYWLKPPQDPDADNPLLTDILPRVRINLHEEQK